MPQIPPVIDEELALLTKVNAVVEQEPIAKGPSETRIVKELDDLREMLVAGTETKDHAAISQQYAHQEALLRQLRAARPTTHVERDSPYFAHLRLRENGSEWDLCLGKATLIKGDVYIVDWRNAPISRIFYRYQQGEEYEEEIAERLRIGTVAARRTVTIRNARLERIDAPEGTFSPDADAPEGWRHTPREVARLAGGEAAAVRAYVAGEGSTRRLGTDAQGVQHRLDKHLPDIAGLIDAEQFRLITRPSSGFVVIRGTAGSGKTTVALHRIAYLAYEDETVDSERTLFVVFSTALRNYVSHVLPALGVRRARIRTLHEWAAEQCKRLFPMLPTATRDTVPAVVHRLKLHPALLVAMREHVQQIEGPKNARQVIDDWSTLLSQPERLDDVFTRLAPGAFTDGDLRRATDWHRAQYDSLASWLRGEPDAVGELDPEDHTLLLRAWQLRVGPLPGRDHRPLRYRHIAIDEVQDFSPLEVRVLLDCLDERHSMTLAGDTQQHVMQDAGFTSWDAFFQHLEIAGTAVDTLRIAYRSTRQIVEFALAILGSLSEDEEPPLTTRDGPHVELFRFTDEGAAVGFLADALKDLLGREASASVAVLTPSRAASESYYRGLARSEVPHLRWIQNQDFTFTAGVEVTEIEQVKGLEFDYVVLVEVSTTNFPDTAAARRLLHVGATRAIHQLWLTSVGTPSRVVRAAMGEA